MPENQMNEQTLEVAKEIAKEVAKDVYADAGKPVVKPTGELVGLVPRAVKAAFAPLEKWILHREYSVEETRRLLEKKLENTPPELIEPPEPYIAVPALEYISYCMDNDELRNMYANLLANSMNSVVKNGVHPSFVEIIKQLCPDEAKILRYMSMRKTVPTISLWYENEKHEGIEVVKNFSNIGEIAQCEKPHEINKYFDNLIRLGLIKGSTLSHLTDKNLYEPIKNHQFIQSRMINTRIHATQYDKPKLKEGYMQITDFGEAFCALCVIDTTYAIATIEATPTE